MFYRCVSNVKFWECEGGGERASGLGLNSPCFTLKQCSSFTQKKKRKRKKGRKKDRQTNHILSTYYKPDTKYSININ